MKRISIGILAHVDAGKTTLSEAMLYQSGLLRKLGRVDHQDAFLDTNLIEKERGITIFSKQAIFSLGDTEITLLDTPGHVDFSGEMERVLQVLDYAILVISGADGVQSHTQTLWKLLRRYEIPTFIFINKMDLPNVEKSALLSQLQKELSPSCLDCLAPDFEEFASMEDETLMERFLESGSLSCEEIAHLVARQAIFPCFFGSALKLSGIDEFLDALNRYTLPPMWNEDFGATVFKIARDEQGTRLTYLKVTGGTLKVKALLSGESRDGEPWEEKVDQIRLYSGAKYQTTPEAPAGTVCAVTGLEKTYSGQGLGCQSSSLSPMLQPVMSCQILLPMGMDVHAALLKLAPLVDEDPQLQILWNEQLREIQLQMMGEVQLDVLKRQIRERFGFDVEFGPGNIVYKETIAAPVEGVGHFEPLRHYAEVHLLLEPGEPGSGIRFGTICSEDTLSKNWQRLILTHLMEKRHRGVLTGSPITDVKITLTAGRAHVKHTEGGDFRQATYRAVRQGLMQAQSILLEPWYSFRLTTPSEYLGRAMADIQRMGGTLDPPESDGTTSVLIGKAPVSEMQGYALELTSYSKGHGKLICNLDGYKPCHNADEIIAEIGYDPERDLENTPDSVFCAHGAGYTVKWDEVPAAAHVQSPLHQDKTPLRPKIPPVRSGANSPIRSFEDDKELSAIFERTYGPIKRRELFRAAPTPEQEKIYEDQGPEYLLVDGYNVIFAWDDLRKLARVSFEGARNALADLLCNYQGFRGCAVILVFDAYRVPHGTGDIFKYKNIHIVYTKEAETADMYIEKVTYELAKKRRVRVVTSDNAEQMIILGHGALRVSASLFYEEVKAVNAEIRQIIEANNLRSRLK